MKKNVIVLTCLFLLLNIPSYASKALDQDKLIEAIYTGKSGNFKKNETIYFIPINEQNLSEYNLEKNKDVFSKQQFYVLEAKNIQAGKKFYVRYLKTDNSSAYVGEATVNANGQVIVDGKMMKGRIIQSIVGCRNGEWNGILLVSKDDGYLCAKIVPNPVEATYEDGAKVSLLMCSQDANSFIADCRGFEPNEKLRFISESKGKKVEWTVEVSPTGRSIAIIEPGIVDKLGGVAYLDIVRNNNDKINLKYFWGLKADLRRQK